MVYIFIHVVKWSRWVCRPIQRDPFIILFYFFSSSTSPKKRAQKNQKSNFEWQLPSMVQYVVISDAGNERRLLVNCFQNRRSIDLFWKQRFSFGFDMFKCAGMKPTEPNRNKKKVKGKFETNMWQPMKAIICAITSQSLRY